MSKDIDLLDLIPNSIENAVSLKQLANLSHIDTRAVKLLINKLREEHPICSKTVDGGGYWLTDDPIEIRQFIKHLQNRKNALEETINHMERHLNE